MEQQNKNIQQEKSNQSIQDSSEPSSNNIYQTFGRNMFKQSQNQMQIIDQDAISDDHQILSQKQKSDKKRKDQFNSSLQQQINSFSNNLLQGSQRSDQFQFSENLSESSKNQNLPQFIPEQNLINENSRIINNNEITQNQVITTQICLIDSWQKPGNDQLKYEQNQSSDFIHYEEEKNPFSNISSNIESQQSIFQEEGFQFANIPPVQSNLIRNEDIGNQRASAVFGQNISVSFQHNPQANQEQPQQQIFQTRMLDTFNKKNLSRESLNYVEPEITIESILTNKKIQEIEEFHHESSLNSSELPLKISSPNLRKFHSTKQLSEQDSLQEDDRGSLRQMRSQMLENQSFQSFSNIDFDKKQNNIFNNQNKSSNKCKNFKILQTKLQHFKKNQENLILQPFQKTPPQTQQENLSSLFETNQKLQNIIKNQKTSLLIEQLIETQEILIMKISEDQTNSLMTNEKQGLQDTIKVLKTEIQNLNVRLKSEDIFISMIIHDMRNPINAVISMVDTIQQELEQEKQRAQKFSRIFSGKELDAFKVIQKGIELSCLNQQSLAQQLQAISLLLNSSNNNQSNQNEFQQNISQGQIVRRGSTDNGLVSQIQNRIVQSDSNQLNNLQDGEISSPLLFQSQQSQFQYQSFDSSIKRNLQVEVSKQSGQLFPIDEHDEMMGEERSLIIEQNLGDKLYHQSSREDANSKRDQQLKKLSENQSHKQIERNKKNQQNHISQQLIEQDYNNQNSKSLQIDQDNFLQQNNFPQQYIQNDISVNQIKGNSEQMIKQNQSINKLEIPEEFNFQDDDCDEFLPPSMLDNKFMRPSDRLQRDFQTNTNELNKLIGCGNNQTIIDHFENQLQRYIEKDGFIIENPCYKTLYELVNVSQERIVILEKQYIFTGAQSIIPQNQSEKNIEYQFKINNINDLNERKNKFYQDFQKIKEQNIYQDKNMNKKLDKNPIQFSFQNQNMQSDNIFSNPKSQALQNHQQHDIQSHQKLIKSEQNQIPQDQIQESYHINQIDNQKSSSESRQHSQQSQRNILQNVNRQNSNQLSLHSMAQQAQLLIQLQNNSSIESHAALIELQKIQDSIKEYLNEKKNVNKIKNLSEGLSFQAKMLLNLVNDLLDYAKFENGNFVFLKEVFNLADLIKKNSFSTLQFQAEEKKIKLKYSVSLELSQDSQLLNYNFSALNKEQFQEQIGKGHGGLMDYTVYEKKTNKIIEQLFLKRIIGDERRYLQILLNFLSNSLKFSQKNGTISVNLRIKSLKFEKQNNQKIATEQLIKNDKGDSDSSDEPERVVTRKMSKLLNSIAAIQKNDQSQFQQNNIQLIYEKQIKSSQSNKLNRNSNDKIDNVFSHGSHEIVFTKSGVQQKENQKEEPESENLSEEDSQFIIAHIHFIIEVVDNGIGIKKENLGKLFLEFSKLDEQSKMNRQGTGLGLTISRKMVRQMGGDITVQSEFGKGTTFQIYLSSKAKIAKSDLQKFQTKEIACSKQVQFSKDKNNESFYEIQSPSFKLQKSQPNSSQLLSNLLKSQGQNQIEPLQFQQFLGDKKLPSLNNLINISEVADKISEFQSKLSNKESENNYLKNISFSSSSQNNSKNDNNEEEDEQVKLQKNQMSKENEMLSQLLRQNILNNWNNLGQISQHSLFNNLNYVKPRSNSQVQHPIFKISSDPQQIYQRNFVNSSSSIQIIKSIAPYSQCQSEQNQKLFSQQNLYDKGNHNYNSFSSRNQFKQSQQHFGINSQQNQEQFSFQNSNQDQRFNIPNTLNNIQPQINGQIFNDPNSYQYYIHDQNFPQNPPASHQPSQISSSLQIQSDQKSKKIRSSHSAQLEQVIEQINQPKSSSSLSQTFLKSFFEHQKFENPDHESEPNSRKLKCLVANDEEFQLQMKVICLKKVGFKVHKAENGQVAFNKVRYFIDNYNKVRQRLQHPDANYKNLNSQEQKLIQTTLKNYDLIILDLNMPILNGYQACQRICEVYQSFNSLPDYDDIVSNSSKEAKHLEAIHKIFLENDIPYQEDSDKMSQLSPKIKKLDSKPDQQLSHRSLIDMIKNVKEFYEFRRMFNGMLRVRPLMVACSADISPDIKEQAKQSGFDIFIQAPLTEEKIRELIIVELEKKHQIQARMKEENSCGSFQSQIINHKKIWSVKIADKRQESVKIINEQFFKNFSNEE